MMRGTRRSSRRSQPGGGPWRSPVRRCRRRSRERARWYPFYVFSVSRYTHISFYEGYCGDRRPSSATVRCRSRDPGVSASRGWLRRCRRPSVGPQPDRPALHRLADRGTAGGGCARRGHRLVQCSDYDDARSPGTEGLRPPRARRRRSAEGAGGADVRRERTCRAALRAARRRGEPVAGPFQRRRAGDDPRLPRARPRTWWIGTPAPFAANSSG